MMTTGFLLLGAGGIVAGGVGALVGLVLWLTLLVGIAAKGGTHQTWRRFRLTRRISAATPAVSQATSGPLPPCPIAPPPSTAPRRRLCDWAGTNNTPRPPPAPPRPSP